MNGLHALLREPVLGLQLLLDGLWIGAPYALIAIGMMLLWRLTGIINIAQGEFVMLGGFITLAAIQAGLHPLLAMLLTVPLMFVFGWLLHLLLVRHVTNADATMLLLAMFGLSLILRQLLLHAFGNTAQTVESGLGMSLPFGGMLVVPHARVLAFLLTCLVAPGLWLLFRHARWQDTVIPARSVMPCSMPAVAGLPQHAEGPRAAVFAINAALCGAAGALLLLAWSIHPLSGLSHTLRAFLLVVIGGLGSPLGIIVAAPALGIAEQVAGFLPDARFQLLPLFLPLLLLLATWHLALRARRCRGKHRPGRDVPADASPRPVSPAHRD